MPNLPDEEQPMTEHLLEQIEELQDKLTDAQSALAGVMGCHAWGDLPWTVGGRVASCVPDNLKKEAWKLRNPIKQ